MPKAIYAPHDQNRSQKIDMIIPGFTGMNNTDDPAAIVDTDLVQAFNVVYDSVGSVQTRYGSLKILTTSLGSPLLGMGRMVDSARGYKQLLYASNQSLYRYDNAGSSIAFTGTYSAATRWQFTMMNGKSYAVNGQDGLLEYTGSGNWTVINSTYKPVGICAYKNRLYLFEDNSRQLIYTDAFAPSSIPAGNVFQFNDTDEIITALNGDIDELTIGRSNSVWYITGEPLGSGNTTTLGNIQLKKASSEVGPTNVRAITTISQGLQIFVANNGIYVLQGHTATNISPEITKTFQVDTNPDYMSLVYVNYNRSQKKFIAGFPSSGSQICDRMIMLDLAKPREAKYAIWDNMPGSCAINFRFSEGRDTTLIAHPTKGFIYQIYTGYFDIYGDTGTATSATSTTLSDTTKSWPTNALADASVTIVSGLGRGQRRYAVSNTATQVTVDNAWTITPDSTSVYTIGGYNSFADTKIFNMAKPALDKKLKFWDVFTDSEGSYNLQYAVVYDYLPLGNYTDLLSLDSGSLKWGQIDPVTGVRMKWGVAGYKWGGKKKLHRRAELGGEQAKQVQYRFGNNLPNQPWRVSMHVTTYKEKKNRAD